MNYDEALYEQLLKKRRFALITKQRSTDDEEYAITRFMECLPGVTRPAFASFTSPHLTLAYLPESGAFWKRREIVDLRTCDPPFVSVGCLVAFFYRLYANRHQERRAIDGRVARRLRTVPHRAFYRVGQHS